MSSAFVPAEKTLGEKLFGPITMAIIFIAPGILHLARPKIYEPIMPPPLKPKARELILLSGVAEIVGGLLYLPQRTRQLAAWYLVALLAAVFPSNIYMTTQEKFQKSVPGGLPALLARLPLQFIGMWWLVRLARRTAARAAASE